MPQPFLDAVIFIYAAISPTTPPPTTSQRGEARRRILATGLDLGAPADVDLARPRLRRHVLLAHTLEYKPPAARRMPRPRQPHRPRCFLDCDPLVHHVF